MMAKAKVKIARLKRRLPEGEEYKWPKNTGLRMVGPKKDGNIEEENKITRDNPLEPPRLYGFSNASEQSWFLRALAYSHVQERDDWDLMLDPIGFQNRSTRKKWRGFHDARSFKCFVDWHKGPQVTIEWAQKIAIFNAFDDSWDEGHDSVWKRRPWQTWAAVLRPLHHLTKMQQRLTLYLVKGKGLRMRNIFIRGSARVRNCAEKTGEFIREIVTQRWSLPIPWNAMKILESWYYVRQSESQCPVVASATDKIDGFDEEWPEMPEMHHGQQVTRIDHIEDDTDQEWETSHWEVCSNIGDNEVTEASIEPPAKWDFKGEGQEVFVDNSNNLSQPRLKDRLVAEKYSKVGKSCESILNQEDEPMSMSPLRHEQIDKTVGWPQENLQPSVEIESHSPAHVQDKTSSNESELLEDVEEQLELALKRKELELRQKEIDLDREEQAIANMRYIDLRSRTQSLRATLERRSASRSSELSSRSRSRIRKDSPTLSPLVKSFACVNLRTHCHLKPQALNHLALEEKKQVAKQQYEILLKPPKLPQLPESPNRKEVLHSGNTPPPIHKRSA
ncbi:hypothetical protein HYALB_00009420 [Hymenoscyphus albidus]|uniref:Uncharacterized protein n=1 Tax=Hymenoscyphus albidus TaxID=595503 RepID=A0A9N9Q5U2_9HELO|nr:hypothetical protein HYALB_00009420 [Hymenoscyphus albidus]